MLNLLWSVKCNGRFYPLEVHVSNHRQSNNDLMECSERVQCDVPRPDKKVECLVDIINFIYSTLQVAVGIIRAMVNSMR